jgi:cyclic-di-GMP phosphodiesterase TipF (flagellum assembly factor)
MLQTLYFACYAVAAIAIAFAVPRYFSDAGILSAVLSGAVVFLAGALAHEFAVRRHNASRDLHRLILLHRAHVRLRDDFEQLVAVVSDYAGAIDTDDVAAARPAKPARTEPTLTEPTLGEQMPPAPAFVSEPPPTPVPRGPADMPPRNETSDGLAVEVKILHDLMQRLYEGSAAGGGMQRRIEDPKIELIRDALRQNRLELYGRPIVTLPQRKRRFYDSVPHVLSPEGVPVPPDRYADAVREHGLATAFENMLLFRSIQRVHALRSEDPTVGYLCRATSRNLSDREFIGDLIAYHKGDGSAGGLAIGVTEKDLIGLDGSGLESLGQIAREGVPLCLCRPEKLDMDSARLFEHGFRMIKVDASVLMAAIPHDLEADRMRLLKRALDRAGIDLIVENIDTEQKLVELLDFNIDFGLGPLFGETRRLEPGAEADTDSDADTDDTVGRTVADGA